MTNEKKAFIFFTVSMLFTIIGGCLIHIGLGAIIVGLWCTLLAIAHAVD